MPKNAYYLLTILLGGPTITAGAVLAGPPATGDQAEPHVRVEKNIRAGLSSLAPDIQIDRIQPGPVEGLYEVIIGTDVVYMSSDGRYVFRGELLDLHEQRNVSESVRASVRRDVLSHLSVDDMIRFSNGRSEHVVYVFTDTDCGYCRKLHNDVPYLIDQGVEVRYLAYPRDGLDSATFSEMEAVWCADDRQAALTRAKQGRKVQSKQCASPVAAQYEAGRLLGVRGTPAIFLENGRELPGYVPPQKLLAILNGGS